MTKQLGVDEMERGEPGGWGEVWVDEGRAVDVVYLNACKAF